MAFLPTLLLAAAVAAAEPTLLVQPYVQPGPQGTLGATDEVKVIWMTEPTNAAFTLEYAPKGLKPIAAKIARTEFEFAPPPSKAVTPAEKAQRYVRYVASLPGLPANGEYGYTLRADGKVLGVLGIGKMQPYDFTAAEIAALNKVAELISAKM